MSNELEWARRLVLAHGWNATSYQILNPGIRLWFAAEGDAVVGYVRHGRTRVVAGAPVCATPRLADVAAAFEADAAAEGARVCYFGAESRLAATTPGARRYTPLLLGSQPAWQPQRLLAAFATHASLRAQLHRARNKGVHVAEWPAARAAAAPELRSCLREWLATRGLPPLHFLVESQTLDVLLDRRVFVAECDGRVVAFLVATPIPARSGWLIEQLVRGAAACNGTSELLLAAAADAAAAAGIAIVTLGLAPLADRTGPVDPLPPLHVRMVLGWLRAHCHRFYDFRGLEAWKAKFQPERWEPVYALMTTPRVTLRTLYAIAGAFACGSPAALLGKALWRALASEATRWWRAARGGRLTRRASRPAAAHPRG